MKNARWTKYFWILVLLKRDWMFSFKEDAAIWYTRGKNQSVSAMVLALPCLAAPQGPTNPWC